jgi:hypothetical protein
MFLKVNNYLINISAITSVTKVAYRPFGMYAEWSFSPHLTEEQRQRMTQVETKLKVCLSDGNYIELFDIEEETFHKVLVHALQSSDIIFDADEDIEEMSEFKPPAKVGQEY